MTALGISICGKERKVGYESCVIDVSEYPVRDLELGTAFTDVLAEAKGLGIVSKGWTRRHWQQEQHHQTGLAGELLLLL